jgi:MarR family transcriptional regulator, organic hydroperoxide resistance regulator
MSEPRESQLQRELRQTRAFRSRAQEATVGILRTADVARRRMTGVIEPFGVTMQQYNVLRILRGAHPDPLPTLEIGERLIERVPGITRLLDRLEEKALVRRERCSQDRRLVHCWITAEGRELLGRMDAPVDRADDELVQALDPGEIETLIDLLDRVRRNAPGD